MENVRKDDHQFSTLHTQKANIEIKGSNKQSKDLDFRWIFYFHKNLVGQKGVRSDGLDNAKKKPLQ